MSPFGISIDQTLHHLRQSFKSLESLPQRLNADKNVNGLRENPTKGVEVRKGLSAFRRLQAINARSNWEAMNVRAADQIMDTIGKYIEEMKAQLERIIKNFPPFPPGSEERVKILRSYNALRKQIDQMAFQSKDQGATKIKTDSPFVGKVEKMGAKAGTLRALLPKDLDIPELLHAATDQEISVAIESLNAAREILQEGRARLAPEALEISSSEIAKKKAAALKLGNGKELESDLPEGAAELKSQEIQHALSIESISGLTETPSWFIDLLE